MGADDDTIIANRTENELYGVSEDCDKLQINFDVPQHPVH